MSFKQFLGLKFSAFWSFIIISKMNPGWLYFVKGSNRIYEISLGKSDILWKVISVSTLCSMNFSCLVLCWEFFFFPLNFWQPFPAAFSNLKSVVLCLRYHSWMLQKRFFMLQLKDYDFRQVKVAKEIELKPKSLVGKNTRKHVESVPSFQLCFNYVSLWATIVYKRHKNMWFRMKFLMN